MTATFDAKITVVERVPGELIRFNAVGKSVRGAIGNVRTSNAVRLRADEDGTLVTVEGDVILAGALGSVGQKVVAKQAAKVTADFAANLQAALGGEVVEVVGAAGARARQRDTCRASGIGRGADADVERDRGGGPAPRRRRRSSGSVDPYRSGTERPLGSAEHHRARARPEEEPMSELANLMSQDDSIGMSEPSVVVTIEVNGTTTTAQVPTRLSLADFLRHNLGLTGTHVGCEQGVCGMCTVLLDGEAVKSCLIYTAQLDGQRVETVESLAATSALSPLQQMFKDEHGLQCGFCTPAFLMTTTALARDGRKLSRTRHPRGARRRALPLHGL